MAERIVLAYSGGLDTSAATKWLQEDRGYEVICLLIDLGNVEDMEGAERRANEAGAIEYAVVDARDDFMRYFAFPALAANAVYEGEYPLATALGRPLIAKLLVDKAREVGATAVAHGCTGKGNDQVRFDVAIATLAPDLTIVGTAREHQWTREEALEYCRGHGISVEGGERSPYSIDENMWGRAIEAGELEDPWVTPPEDAYQWTRPIDQTPDEPAEVELGFEQGMPVSLDGERISPVDLVDRLNELAGTHGVGRLDMVENRLVGIKSREVYEAPAAVALLAAHHKLETLTLTKDQMRMKARVAQEYADLVYNGQWFSAHHQDLASYVQSTQRHVTGEVRLRLWRGHADAVGTRSERSLYNYALATYGAEDDFDQQAALGFIKLWGLPLEVQARQQLLREPADPLRLAAP
ncbi:MAG: argininosuccinate synthase, partial [Chloroflexi bacterium]|nr:argininosuccinate synthase [Chloroflexota bacterium]